jgi:hypothetical protein
MRLAGGAGFVSYSGGAPLFALFAKGEFWVAIFGSFA